MARCYTTIELLAQRVARAFENHIDPSEGWHVEILRRLSLDIPGVRPPLFPLDLLPDLQNLRAFRYVIRHAYELRIVPEDLAKVLEKAERVASRITVCFDTFCDAALASFPDEGAAGVPQPIPGFQPRK